MYAGTKVGVFAGKSDKSYKSDKVPFALILLANQFLVKILIMMEIMRKSFFEVAALWKERRRGLSAL